MQQNLRLERLRSGMTPEQAAGAIGIASTALERWESGEDEPPASAIAKLSLLYGCTAEYLLGMTEDRHGACIASASCLQDGDSVANR